MANFCMKCGNPLDVGGLCPRCDAPTAPKFCAKCGTPTVNGLCPYCDAPATPIADPEATVILTGEPEAVALSDAAAATATAVPVETVPVEIKAPRKASSLSVIATVLLSICLFITTTLAVGVLTVRNTISEGGMTDLAEQVDVPEMLKASGVADSDVFDNFYERLERDYGIRMNDKKLAELLEDSTVPEYVAEKIGSFSDDFFSGDAELVVTKDEMVDLLYERQNRRLLEKEISDDFEDTTLSKADCQHIANWLFTGDELVLLSTDQLQDSSPLLYQTINIGLSYVAMVFFLLLSALIIFVMCRNSLSQAAIGGGVVFMLLGGVTSLAAAVVAWIPGLWSSIAGSNLILNLIGSVLVINALIFVTILVVGILLPIVRTVVKRMVAKKQ